MGISMRIVALLCILTLFVVVTTRFIGGYESDSSLELVNLSDKEGGDAIYKGNEGEAFKEKDQPNAQCIKTIIKNNTGYALYFDINPTALNGRDMLVNQRIETDQEKTFCFSSSIPLGIDRDLNRQGLQMGIFIINPGCFVGVIEKSDEVGMLDIIHYFC